MATELPPPTLPERRRAAPRWTSSRIHDLTASLMILGALAVVGTLALRGSESAAGALISILAAATGWLMRGRLEAPPT